MTASGSNAAAAFFGGNQHNDVLHANPGGEDEKARLVAELKRRGNAAFQCKSLAEADVLYSRAIEHDPSVVALFGNRSMVRNGMGQFDAALEDAESCIKLDPSWAKGYFRKATALVGLDRMDDAEAAFKKCLEVEPGNKVAQRELEAMPKHREAAAKRRAAEEKRKAEQAAAKKVDEADRVVSKKIVEVSKAKSSSSSSSSGGDGDGDKEAPATVKKGTSKSKQVDMSMRGYRTLADGRKTTYFNRELTEEEKEMLKDNKPKQMAEDLEAIKAKEAELTAAGSSAWNQGGTFEERIMTEWATKALKAAVMAAKCSVMVTDQDGDVLEETIKVSDVKAMEGDASIAFTRGKKRHIFDFNLEALWQIEVGGEKVKGGLFLPDISGDAVTDGEVVEAELRWSQREKAGKNQAAIAKALMDSDPVKGLLGAINAEVHKFAAEFRAKE